MVIRHGDPEREIPLASVVHGTRKRFRRLEWDATLVLVMDVLPIGAVWRAAS